MTGPLEITFHNMDASPTLEADIRDRFEKLQRLYERLTGARVSVEALHKQHRTGNLHEVHIELFLPGGAVAVSHQPGKVKERFAHPDVRTCMREAFKMVERRLTDFKERRRGAIGELPRD